MPEWRARMTARDNLPYLMTGQELLTEVSSVVSLGRARRLISRAHRVAGVRRRTASESREPLKPTELLLILESIAAEGGELQTRAELLARRTLYPEPSPEANVGPVATRRRR